jgi:hypothetical protein
MLIKYSIPLLEHIGVVPMTYDQAKHLELGISF